jgi:hypothetical protein
MRTSSPVSASLLTAAFWLAACGGSGGGDGGPPQFPLLPDDELVSPMSPDTSTNEIVGCSAGPRIYVAWVERSNVVADAVLFNRSLDGGATWLASAVPVSDPASSAGDVAMCCDGDRVYVAYHVFSGSNQAIRLNRSLDAGTTFLPDEALVSEEGADGKQGTAICCEGLLVHVAWTDERDGERDVRYNRSIDGGATFPTPDVPLESDTPGATSSRSVSLCCDGPRVYAAWVDSRSGEDAIRMNRSVNGGVTFLPADVSVSHASVPTGAVGRPQAVCEGATVAIVWSDARNGLGDVFCNRATDSGVTFLGTDRRVDTDLPGAAASSSPIACLEDDVLHVVWDDLRSGTSRLRYNRSEDAGATFLPEDAPLGETPSGADVSDAEIACDGDTIAVAWQEDRPPFDLSDVFVAVSTDGGRSFEEARADTDPPGASLSFNPVVALDGPALVVVWGESRDGIAEIRVNRTAP